MSRNVMTTVAMTGMACVMTVILVAGQQSGQKMGTSMQGHDMSMTGMKSDMKMTKAQKIANAVSAAPAAIGAKAAVLDWPAKEGMAPETLRAGTNGWSCLPDDPMSKGNDPMCLDESWMTWVQAYIAHKTPQIAKVGIGYMIAPGGGSFSNTDPYATMETKDNHWSHHPPHVMIVVPDTKALAGVSTDPNNGGPYVMFAGTPYAHIMAPLASAPMKSMK